MKRFLKIGVVLSFVAAFAGAQASAVQTAEEQFAAGDYAAAARSFDSALSANGPSAALYHNLALAQQRSDQSLPALLSYRRAIMLDPRLESARTAAASIEKDLGISSTPTWQDRVAAKAPLQQLLIGGVVLAWIGSFGVLVFAILSRRAIPAAASVLVLIVGSGIAVASYLSDPRVADRSAALVMAKDAVTLHSVPADQSDAVAKAAPGSSLKILSQRGPWTYCQSPDGLKGWVTTSSIESIVPQPRA